MKIMREIESSKIRGKEYESEKGIEEKMRGNARLKERMTCKANLERKK